MLGMEPSRKTARWQLPLWSLLIVVLIAPPDHRGRVFLVAGYVSATWGGSHWRGADCRLADSVVLPRPSMAA